SYYSGPSYYGPSGLGSGSADRSPGLSTYPLLPGNTERAPRSSDYQPMPPAGKPDDKTYPYDGGPNNPVPMPKADPAPNATPQKGVPVPNQGRLVSLPEKQAKYSYAAYGEQPGKASRDESVLTKKVQK